jgi:hypothetical protein
LAPKLRELIPVSLFGVSRQSRGINRVDHRKVKFADGEKKGDYENVLFALFLLMVASGVRRQ